MPESMHAPSIIAAVDVGSNSIKLTVARADRDGRIEPLSQAMETVRLGAGVSESGQLAEDRIAAALVVLRRFGGTALALGATRLVGVATEAVRQADNGQEFLRRVGEETGWSVRLISGDEEAALTFRGLTLAVDLRGYSIIADIGGGSTELIVANDATMTSSRSLPLGSGTLTERLVQHDPPTATELSVCQDKSRAVFAPLALAGPESPRLIAIGGTGEYLARLVPSGHALVGEVIASVLARLTTLDAATLAELIRISPARARVLPAGIAVVLALTDLIHPAAIATGPSGIRLGLIAETVSPRPAQALTRRFAPPSPNTGRGDGRGTRPCAPTSGGEGYS